MTSEELHERLKTGRNEPCPCGSGKKYKKCHRAEDESAAHADARKREEAAQAAAAASAENEEDDGAEAGTSSGKRSPAGGLDKKGRTKPGGTSNAPAKNLPRRRAV